MALRRMIAASVVALGMVAGLAPATARPVAPEEMLQMFNDLRSGALTPKLASSECLTDMVKSDEAEDMRQVMSTYLEVSRSNALPAFCDALVQAVQQGLFEPEDLIPIIDPRDERAESYAMGRLLRVIYFTHYGISPALLTDGARR